MKQTTLQRTLSGLGGRFFGLETVHGNRVNARVVNITPSYVTVYDNNAGLTRKFHKNSISSITVGGKTVR